MARRVRIFDTTLRDGEQTPRVAFSPAQKVEIASALDALGVDAIEAGFPVVSAGEHEAVSAIAAAGLRADIFGLARSTRKDVDAIVDAGLQCVHTFIATSAIHAKDKLGMSQQAILDAAIDAIEYAKSRGLVVEFSAEDATRSDPKYLHRVYSAAAQAGADRANIPDTTGYSTPEHMAQLVRDVIDASGLPVSVHCHNDFGLATANTLAGIDAGAASAHVTINGIGERAGNASLEEVVSALEFLDPESTSAGGHPRSRPRGVTGIKTRRIYEVSQLVSHMARMQVQNNKAIVGENAFGHESGIHTHGIVKNPLTYESLDPRLVGRKRWFAAGKHAGTHGVETTLSEYGMSPSGDELAGILERVKEMGDSGANVSDMQVVTIASEIMGKDPPKRLVRLRELDVSTNASQTPHAYVKLAIGDTDHDETASGVGPVDASLAAIQEIVGGIYETRIADYSINAVSGGSDALCEVTVKVEDARGNTVRAKSVGEDIVVTSVRAVIEGINEIALRRGAESSPRQRRTRSAGSRRRRA